MSNAGTRHSVKRPREPWAKNYTKQGQGQFLILDNLRVHHSKPVKTWLAERTNQIEVFYLPSYSPELNPEERLNADLKQAMGSQDPRVKYAAG